jgi:biotin operon repressor
MIAADDPRHGDYAGYRAGCRCDSCEVAGYRYNTRLHADHDRGIYRTVPALGTARRIHALQALGWSLQTIGDQIGSSAQTLYRIANEQDVVWSSTRDAVAEVYERLCMTLADDRLAGRKRLAAQRKGYRPPMAWDDIDLDPDTADETDDDVLDEVAIERALQGHRVTLNEAEKLEALTRHLEAGGTKGSFERLTGFNGYRILPTCAPATLNAVSGYILSRSADDAAEISGRQVAADLDMAEDTVRAALTRLLADGFMTVDLPPAGKRYKTRYRISTAVAA